MTLPELQKKIKSAKKAYAHCANIEIESNKLIIRNTGTGVLHPWITGEMFISVSNAQKIHIIDLL